MRSLLILVSLSFTALGTVGCSTWDSMSSRDKATVGGAAAGGVIGGAASGGGPLGTIGGAAVGGVIGNQVEKKREQ